MYACFPSLQGRGSFATPFVPSRKGRKPIVAKSWQLAPYALEAAFVAFIFATADFDCVFSARFLRLRWLELAEFWVHRLLDTQTFQNKLLECTEWLMGLFHKIGAEAYATLNTPTHHLLLCCRPRMFHSPSCRLELQI
jgi:hypothetical protein